MTGSKDCAKDGNIVDDHKVGNERTSNQKEKDSVENEGIASFFARDYVYDGKSVSKELSFFYRGEDEDDKNCHDSNRTYVP
jgi:hypothetical protein